MNEKPDVKYRVTAQSVDELVQLQSNLLDAVCPYVKKGGTLVYSTCSVLKDENVRQAEKFRRPIFTFIDTAGAYPGLEAEEHGQGEAIARNLFEMSRLTVPVIAVVTGEGNSGGALALAVADRVLMLENAVYAILSPEGFASILWKDAQRSGEAAELMKLTAPEVKKLGVIDGIVREPEGGAQTDPSRTLWNLDRALTACLEPLLKESAVSLTERRYQKFRALGRGKEDA